MKITTKYDVGDRVYPITQEIEIIYHKCADCHATGEITTKEDKVLRCPTCFGRKLIEKRNPVWKRMSSSSREILEIRIICHKDREVISYFLGEETFEETFEEEELFLSLEEAELACQRRNQPIDKKMDWEKVLNLDKKREKNWVNVKDELPSLNQKVMCRLEHWNTHVIKEYELQRVEESDCMWRTADDNSEIDYNWIVIQWKKE